MSNLETQEAVEEIAIIGMAGRFPGARNIDAFWRNLREGVESVSFFSAEDLEAAGVEASLLRQPNYVRAKAVLDDVDLFDASFFGFNPREAEITDPQHRFFLECAWEALEHAGYNSDAYDGSIAVFAGASWSNYLLNLLSGSKTLDFVDSFRMLLGNDKDHLPTWTSYKLNLRGPSVNVQTACSTSLVAVHLACQSLLNYQCDMALAGGVTISVPQKSGYLYEEGGINSPDGHCRAFDAQAQGSVSGSGVGVVILKRLEESLADGDDIHAVIKGSSLNNDGATKMSYTAPSIDGQAEVIATALAVAGIAPETVGYIEAHGSGTALGDPIEIAALTQAFQEKLKARGAVALGSVKTNIGHTGAAAGIAGLIKTVLALKNKALPPSLHFAEPNPQIDFANSPFYVNTELRDWKTDGTPRRAGVSSFGIGGTNVHTLVEEAPPPPPSAPARPSQLLLLSARTRTALEAASDNLLLHLREHPEENLADLSYTLQVGRKAFAHRRALVCHDRRDALQVLETRAAGRIVSGVYEPQRLSIVFMFPGLGDHYVNMAAGLYQAEPEFRKQVDACCELLRPDLGFDLREVLYPTRDEAASDSMAQPEPGASPSSAGVDLRRMLLRHKDTPDATTDKLNQTAVAQPALFVIEYALARLWMKWGVRPAAMIGYSIGEYVVACLAGVLSLKDALRLVSRRARMIENLAGGAMLAVPLPEGRVRSILSEELSIAGINGPSLCVVSGAPQAVAVLERRLAGEGVACRQLTTTHAFHSSMMNLIAADFAKLVGTVTLNEPRIPYISNVTGTWITAAEATDPQYWTRHLCEAVRFADGLAELSQEPGRLFLEVGPGQMLSSLVIQQTDFDRDKPRASLSSIRHLYDRQDDRAFLLNTLGQLWLAGVEISWPDFYEHEKRRRVALPTYPFERRRFWIERQTEQDAAPDFQPTSPSKKQNPADWFYLPSWKRSLPPRAAARSETSGRDTGWLVLADQCGLGTRLAEQLEREGSQPVTVLMGEHFTRVNERVYAMHPQRLEDYAALLEELSGLGHTPTRVMHLWGITSTQEQRPPGAELFLRSQNGGFNSLLYLAESLGEKYSRQAIDICVVTNGMHDVGGEERLCPEKATALIPGRVVPRVYPQLTCRYVDLTVPEAGSLAERSLLGQLVAELTPRSSGEIIAYRDHHRWVQDFQRVKLEEESEASSRLRRGGVYLLTGSLNASAYAIAEYLVAAWRGRLVLIEEPGFPARQTWASCLENSEEAERWGRRIKQARALEELGGEVEMWGANVADEAEMRGIVARAYERFGALHGVFHTAEATGAEASKPLDGKSSEGVQNYQTKVYGAYVLDQVLQNREIDFCLLLSSLTTIVGGGANMPYEAANAFLDAFAHAHGRVTAPPWTSVNWDDEVTAAEVAEILPRIFSMAPVSQIVISTTDLGQRRQTNSAGATGQHSAANPGLPLHERPELGVPYVAPGGPTEQTVAEIWQGLLGIGQIGIHDNFFHMGGNSLVAIQLTNQLRQAFQVSVPVQAIFEATTVQKLAEVIEDILLTEIERLGEAEASRYLT